MKIFFVICLILLSTTLFAQNQVVDNSNASRTIPYKMWDKEPGTCAVGEMYKNTTTGGATRQCIATNTWADFVVKDSSGNVTVGATVLLPGGTSLPATCTVGQLYFLTTGATGLYNCTATNVWTLPGGGDVLRGAICITAGCGSETSLNGIMMNGSGTLTTCGFNLLTAPTGSSVTVEIDKNGVSATTLTLATSATKIKSTGLSISFADQDIFTWKITANDSGLTAQGGTVQCWR